MTEVDCWMWVSQKLLAGDKNRRQEIEFIKKTKNLKFKAKQLSRNINEREEMRDKFA
jgi:hypothetical protein